MFDCGIHFNFDRALSEHSGLRWCFHHCGRLYGQFHTAVYVFIPSGRNYRRTSQLVVAGKNFYNFMHGLEIGYIVILMQEMIYTLPMAILYFITFVLMIHGATTWATTRWSWGSASVINEIFY